ncbi:MAG: DUF3090 family protein [Actinobacteria bacterium]|nr:DUF3090 family protein [Actinomycetota bacterium]
MSGNIFLFDPVDRFIVGTVGQPGERSFYIQARTDNRLVAVLVEKDQVAALAARLGQMLRELKRADSSFAYSSIPKDDQPLESPIEEEFRVGAIALSWLDDRSLIAIDFQAVATLGDAESNIDDDDAKDLEENIDVMRVLLTPGQTEMFISRANVVVGAGRPPCPFCGLALDPRGHLCPRANGYRR